VFFYIWIVIKAAAGIKIGVTVYAWKNFLAFFLSISYKLDGILRQHFFGVIRRTWNRNFFVSCTNFVWYFFFGIEAMRVCVNQKIEWVYFFTQCE